MQQQKILLLGGSAQQIVAIEAAKRAGYYTVLIDYLTDNPGQFVADKYYPASTTDVEAVYRIAKEEGVSGILAYASDPAALPAAIVCERLGLPTNPVKSVEILGIKHKFRDFLETHGFVAPRHFDFDSKSTIADIKDRLKNLTFPIVIKPTDSSGSKGVTKLYDTTDCEKAIKYASQYSRNGILIAEEFIEYGYPEVIGGDIFISDGKIVLFGEMSCTRGDNGKSLIPIGEKKPSGLSKQQTELVHKELQRLVDALDIKFGEMNIEIILGKDNQVYFLELGPRAGGNMIPVQLNDIFGIDLQTANVRAAMGESIDLKIKEPHGAYMTYVLHSKTDGKFAGISISEEVKPYIYRQVIYKKVDDAIEAFDGAGKAIGIMFLHFDDEQTMKAIVNQISNHIQVVLK